MAAMKLYCFLDDLGFFLLCSGGQAGPGVYGQPVNLAPCVCPGLPDVNTGAQDGSEAHPLLGRQQQS